MVADWSARSAPSRRRPSRDAIWIGEVGPEGGGAAYHRTRRAAFEAILERLLRHVAARRRVLVGFDFAYGYPAGLAGALGPRAPGWRGVWDTLAERIQDDERNRNNRFAVAAELNRLVGPGPGPFWGCPARAATAHLTVGMRDRFAFPYPAGAGRLERLRATERMLRGLQETWKLVGAGSVGGQALLGIPYVRRLRDHPGLAAVSRVWPFETAFGGGLPRAGPAVVHAEVWPGVVDAEALARAERAGEIRDAAQVRLLCAELARGDRAGRLGDWLAPAGLPDAVAAVAIAEEGWILGAPWRGGLAAE